MILKASTFTGWQVPNTGHGVTRIRESLDKPVGNDVFNSNILLILYRTRFIIFCKGKLISVSDVVKLQNATEFQTICAL
jgi:hypothetical protein